MSQQNIDATGLVCPQPVILTRKAITEPGVDEVVTLVDTAEQAENVSRMAKKLGCEVDIVETNNRFEVRVSKGETDDAPESADSAAALAAKSGAPSVVAWVTSEFFGSGDDELGRILMTAFVKTLKEIEPRPGKVIFANSGVRLTTEGSELLDVLAELEASGVEILSCGTCLDFFNLMDKLKIGKASNMYEITMALAGADRVVKP